MKTLKTVLLIMRRASLAQGLMAKARDDPGLRLWYEPDYANADAAIRSHRAAGALLEVAERKGEIDDFVFYDVSLDYLAASLQSL